LICIRSGIARVVVIGRQTKVDRFVIRNRTVEGARIADRSLVPRPIAFDRFACTDQRHDERAEKKHTTRQNILHFGTLPKVSLHHARMPNEKPRQDRTVPSCRVSQEIRDKFDRLLREKKIKWSVLAREAIETKYREAFGDEPPKPQRTRRKKD
jgi:hypothetical protein